MISIGLGCVFVGIVLFYAYLQSRAIIAGPQIVLESPQNGITATTSLLAIRGTITNAKETTLNGRTLFIDLKGNFSEQLLLAPGYNIIELTAKDTKGREVKRVLEIVYDEEETSMRTATTSSKQDILQN